MKYYYDKASIHHPPHKQTSPSLVGIANTDTLRLLTKAEYITPIYDYQPPRRKIKYTTDLVEIDCSKRTVQLLEKNYFGDDDMIFLNLV